MQSSLLQQIKKCYIEVELFTSEDIITPKRKALMFQDVADMYHIINNDTLSLFVYRYDNDSLRLYNEIKDKPYLNHNDFQQVSQFSVQVYDRFAHDNAGRIIELENGVRIWCGSYSGEFGLSNEDELFLI